VPNFIGVDVMLGQEKLDIIETRLEWNLLQRYPIYMAPQSQTKKNKPKREQKLKRNYESEKRASGVRNQISIRSYQYHFPINIVRCPREYIQNEETM